MTTPALVRGQAQSATAAQYGAASQAALNVDVSVQGHLDPSETADIGRLSSLLAKSVRHAEQGHLMQALRSAAKSAELESIAQICFDFQMRADYALGAYRQVWLESFPIPSDHLPAT